MYHDLVLSQGQMHWWFGMDLSAYPLSNHTTNPFTHAVITSASQWVLTIPYLVLIAAAMFLQYYQMKQMNSRNPQAAAANPQMQTMQKFFPIIFGVIYLRVPAGATIYMVVSSAMRIGTQEVMFRTGMVSPVVHEREIGSAKEDKPEKAPPKAPPKPVEEDVDGHGRHGGGQGDAAAGQERLGRPTGGANQRKEAGRGEAGDERQSRRRDETEAPAPKPHPRSRSKRNRKAR